MKRCIPTIIFLMMFGCRISVCGDDEGPLGVFNPPPSPTPEVVAESWEEPVEPEGTPTTVGEPTGNWYLKAQVFKKAEDLFNKLKKQITLVTPSRKDFDGRWQELDKKLSFHYIDRVPVTVARGPSVRVRLTRHSLLLAEARCALMAIVRGW